MQIVTREERYLRAIHESGLCAGLCRKLSILAGDMKSILAARSTGVRMGPSLLQVSPGPIDAAEDCAAWIEEQSVIERMQRAVGHM